MESYARGWRGGRQVWSVEHDSQKDMFHLVTSGELPKAFDEVRDELVRLQNVAGGRDADVDYIFDVPIELADRIVGFRHDRSPEGIEYRFEVMDEK